MTRQNRINDIIDWALNLHVVAKALIEKGHSMVTEEFKVQLESLEDAMAVYANEMSITNLLALQEVGSDMTPFLIRCNAELDPNDVQAPMVFNITGSSERTMHGPAAPRALELLLFVH